MQSAEPRVREQDKRPNKGGEGGENRHLFIRCHVVFMPPPLPPPPFLSCFCHLPSPFSSSLPAGPRPAAL